jgi:hypothetical protein
MLLLTSCGRTDCITTSTAIGIYFTGYDNDSGVQVIVSGFEGSTASVPVQRDTFIIDSNLVYKEVGDSVNGFHLINASPSIFQGYVWQVDVPSTGKRDIISGMEFTHGIRKKQFMEGGGWGNQCINVCTGYYLNGIHVSTGYTEAVSYGASTAAYVELSKH